MIIKVQKGNDAPRVVRCKRPRGWTVREALGYKFGCEFEPCSWLGRRHYDRGPDGFPVSENYVGVQRFPDHNVVVSVWCNDF